jgi:hypothetical protein
MKYMKRKKCVRRREKRQFQQGRKDRGSKKVK